MTRRIYNFDPPDRFVCGTVGRPGDRTFFLQASRGTQLVSVVIEKAQVAVLAERLAMLLAGLRERGVEFREADAPGAPAADGAPLDEPLIEAFRVGTLTLAWDPQHERIVIEAREMRTPLGEPEPDDEDELPDDEPTGPDLVRVHLGPTAAHAFVTRAVAVMQAGRPPCPMCGAPLDPSGHFCPRRNGYTH